MCGYHSVEKLMTSAPSKWILTNNVVTWLAGVHNALIRSVLPLGHFQYMMISSTGIVRLPDLSRFRESRLRVGANRR